MLMRVRDIRDMLEGCQIIGPDEIEISHISCDSRSELHGGSLFAAIEGESLDGYSFIGEALDKGARCVLSERPWPADDRGETITEIIVPDVREALGLVSAGLYGMPSAGLTLVGVTGTNGKTTVTYLLESIFRASGFETGVIGTVNYRYRDSEIPAPNTTPGAPSLQRLLRDMREAGVTHCAMEVSSHGLEQKRVSGCAFDAAVFTNLTHDHMDYHATVEDYFRAKTQLFTHLKAGGSSVVNMDDPWGARLAASLPGLITTGMAEEADIHPRGLSVTPEGIDALVQTPTGSVSVSTAMTGRFNVYNILSAIGVSHALGIEIGAIEEGISVLQGVPGRLQRVFSSAPQQEGGKVPYRAYVDYAHTPDALARLLTTAREMSGDRIILVFGCGGNRDRSKRAEMGEAAARLADIIIVTSDNPRDEDPALIIKDIERGLEGVRKIEKGGVVPASAEKAYMVCVDRREAIEEAVAMAGTGDTLLVAGKGHEDYQITGSVRSHFDDVLELGRAMEQGP
ncbi:MAG: UDP-N-acetylmuramoyl-L-alanyl-D-glutamate--2,6-diaminopimelate ligase [Thermodesulfobacteriota bacterium]